MEPVQIPSLFIPRVSAYLDEAYVENIFWQFLGTTESPIHHIDMVEKMDNRTEQVYYICFVFFRPLERHECEDWVVSFVNDIDNGKQIKIVHSHPWYWNVSKNVGKKRENTRPRILTEKDEASIKEAQKSILASRALKYQVE